ncbi:hypothetical protein TG4357_00022 [Thalassovita gelatinovora]|uniref:Cation/multidrug efflux pump n=1 Tax=Thalassovita gelatinovora TaxID=53501 RepID=A0A0P1FQI4_THAGE|nr:hypothetical protein [Thalassovita gelatinovora]QIZ81774.1 hypothetical protein HFZ77_15470 [Thalassovita gelatinovora]CUH62334.1 hypothetical protein TG4357_00022 [Thalassovita gelatinovora]SER15916.1 hypothetical protein SAMN04488043_11823 [Thalassovita gelatinovora]
MFGLARFLIIGFVILTLIYTGVSLWSRSVRKAKLKKEWEEEIRKGDKEDFVDEGLEDYSHSFRRKLILLVYVVPVLLVLLIIYLVNMN